MAKAEGKIEAIAGPVIKAVGIEDAKINDVVYVGDERLLGEIIEIHGKRCIIQVYEETDGLKPDQKVVSTSRPLSVDLGPGLLTTVYDGVQRPLEKIREQSGNLIRRGVFAAALDEKRRWDFVAAVKVGDMIEEGQVLGTVEETSLITHKILAPLGTRGKVTKVSQGKKRVSDVIIEVGKKKITMKQSWPVKKPRPYLKKEQFRIPLITGQRIYDFFFPTVKGGQTAIPGPFGSGKTVTQQAIAKWCDADIIVYIGCGERGNEMTEVLRDFPKLKDPRSQKPMMDRTVLIANTSNMPVAAREASIYTGITIAEYYRDQGYDVAVMADSTSRWAEALREISGRLEEMPGEEGYPAYLGTRLAQFYERAGRVTALSNEKGSVTIIGAVSPPGGDFSEPVTQNTLNIAKVFWALDAKLASKRHYWAINWLQSYSLYTDTTDAWFDEHIDRQWSSLRKKLMHVLQDESELLEIVQLVGKDSLSKEDQFILLISRIIREDLLQQNALDRKDMFCPIRKQFLMAQSAALFYDLGAECIRKGKASVEMIERSELITDLTEMKYLDENIYEKKIVDLQDKIKHYFRSF